MARQFAWVLLVAFVGAPALNASQTEAQQPPAQPLTGVHAQKPPRPPQDPNRWKWWINPDHRKELGITDAQSRQIDEIFEATMPAQRIKWRQRQELEEAVSKLLKD